MMGVTTDFLHFNWLDIVILLSMALIIIRGFWVGFSRAVSALLGVILGFWFAGNYYILVAHRLSPWIKTEPWQNIAAFALLFLLVYLVLMVVGILVQGFFRVLRLGWIDRLLGGVVGLVKGVILAAVLIFLLTVFLPPGSKILRESFLYPALGKAAQSIGILVPKSFQGRFMWKWRRFSHGSSNTGRKEAI